MPKDYINAGRDDGLKTCLSCTKTLSLIDFHKTRSTGNQGVRAVCKACRSLESVEYYKRFPEKRRAISIRNRYKQKRILVDIYGGCCSCCGETIIDFLTLEHKLHDGKQDRATMTGHKLYKKAIDCVDTDRYTILCMNCNFAEKHGNPCPHKVLKGRVNVEA